MTKRMLIDATHTEETRVAVVDDGRLEEFDYESAFRKPLKGNIFLAKVTRVEPSLQAAFVNFGGNRHGFLPFSEIHPDYFRIPIADREALMAEQEAAILEAEAEEEALAAEDAARIAAGQGRTEGESALADDGNAVMIEEIEDDKDAVDEIGGDLSIEKTRRSFSTEIVEDAEEAVAEDRNEHSNNRSDNFSDDGSDEGSREDEEESIGNRMDDESDAESEEDEVNGNVPGNESEADGNSEQGGRERGRGGRGGRFRGRGRGGRDRNDRGDRGGRGDRKGMDSRRVEKFGGDSVDQEQRFRFNLRRKYKIQEVIKRGQIMLVQVSKEERGNKGAAVGSYLSLPGRYCVLMPNSPRAGGVSRKIAKYEDRARMREIMKDLDVPKGMSVILRTAGVSRTKAEIKRDLDYLMRLWDNIRELTLESTAPALVYEEADLVKRAVRDLYTREIDEIHVSGKEGFETAKNFMKMMMPSHVKKVIEFKSESTTLFNHYKIEKQISDIGETQVTLPSGGYLVINPTEALVSVDVNSGKATKERHIEETALRTNMEAAEEVARQLRLRDLGGLVVIDFIDMEDRRNNAKVERKMRDALSTDRARIQMGRISSFGLMELSRQRLSPSLTESQYELCSHCHGVGRVRTADAASILVLRAIEEEGAKRVAAQVIAHVPSAVALYILNYKRLNLAEIETRYNVNVMIRVDEQLGASNHRIEAVRPVPKSDDEDGDTNAHHHDRARPQAPRPQSQTRSAEEHDEETEASPSSSSPSSPRDEERGGRNRRRGRRGGRNRGRNREDRPRPEGMTQEQSDAYDADIALQDAAEDQADADSHAHAESLRVDAVETIEVVDVAENSSEEASSEEAKPKRGRRPVKKPAAAKDDVALEKSQPAEKIEAPVVISNDDQPVQKAPPAPKEYEKVNEPPAQPKKGWWNRLTE